MSSSRLYKTNLQKPNRKLAINFILPFASLAGGIKSNRLIAEAMVRRGHQVRIAYVSARPPKPNPIRVRSYVRRIRNDWKKRKNIDHHLLTSTAQLVPVCKQSIQFADVPDADVTVATWWETAKWIRYWPESKGIKAYFIRGYELFGGDPDEVKATYRLPYHKFVISKWLQRLMVEEYGDENTILVPNGIDRDQFDSEPRSKGRVPTVGMIYSPRPLKGCDTAFAALRLVQNALPQLRVVSFGAKPLDRKYPLLSNFVFHLAPSQSDIPKLYRSADLWIISSTSEGFSMPGLEAAACRCPIVSTRCGGPEDFIDDGISGYLVEIGNVEEMTKRILEILRMDDTSWRAMSERSYQNSLNFDWDRSAEIFEEALFIALEERSNNRSASSS